MPRPEYPALASVPYRLLWWGGFLSYQSLNDKRLIRAEPSALTERRYDERLECFLGATPMMILERGRQKPDNKGGHVVNYRHVIHALRKKPMALLNLVYRDQLFPRPAFARVFETLRQQAGDKQACKIAVDLLALAHESGCEAELAQAIEAGLEAGQIPDLAVLRAQFTPSLGEVPVIEVKLLTPGAYDELLSSEADRRMQLQHVNLPANGECLA